MNEYFLKMTQILTQKTLDFRLSLDETLIIKGIAICLMLWHHLFYQHPEYGSFVFQSALFGKVCVSLFLFVSGYGLTVQYGKVFDKPIMETFRFQMKRFVKFYANYWVIFLVFVPIGVFVFERSLNIPYEGSNIIKAIIGDFFGINGLQSYNITWWFNQLIVSLYFLFPILYFATKRWPILFLMGSIILWKFSLPILPTGIHGWILHFMLGIVYVLYIDKLNHFLNRFNFWFLLSILLLSFSVLFYMRNYHVIPYFTGTRVDAFLSVNIILLVLLTIRHIHIIHGTLKFLGKHSMNIYMVHTFIFLYWFKGLIYSFKYPIVIFTVLLVSSLVISITIEYLKKIIHLPNLIKTITQRVDKIEI